MDKVDPSLRHLAEEIGRQIARELVADFRRGAVPVEPEYLTTAQAAQWTGFSVKALELYRSKGTGPRFLRVGTSIRYAVDDLRDWIESEGAGDDAPDA